ncbi:MAG TPA: DUF5658 family protein [Clostridia bacterium]|nr:DUF5658 family protein [Clostridia bacterium]
MKKYQLVYYAVFLLTVLDVVFTAEGLKLGAITEANPVVDYLMGLSVGLAFFCILAYVGAALLLIYRLSSDIRWLNAVMAGLAGIKLCILALHIQWVSEYLAVNF